jgi:hypothetical protein
MQNTTFAAVMDAPELIEMTTPSTPAESSQFSRRKFPRRNACTSFMLMNSVEASEPLHSPPMPYKDSCSTPFGKTTSPTPLLPVVSDHNLNSCNFPLKRSLENHHFESGYDGNRTENDFRLTASDVLQESYLGGASLRKHKKRRVSLREPKKFPCAFRIETGNLLPL